MSSVAVVYHNSPAGWLRLCADTEGLCGVHFIRDVPADAPACHSELLLRTARELDEYFAGQRREFDLPLSLHGTAFQLRVWEALRQIPYGQTRSYKQLAAMIGQPSACRAVGGANHHNPVSIIVPCHRVIGADGSLGGYGGGLDKKRILLRLEGHSL